MTLSWYHAGVKGIVVSAWADPAILMKATMIVVGMYVSMFLCLLLFRPLLV